MSVVLRCQNCGTRQRHVGECEACSEGEVRYFCTNHDEGMWLEGPVCSRCGAKFGEPAGIPAPVAPPPPIAARPAGAPDFRPPAGRRTPEHSDEPEFEVRRPRRRDDDDPEAVDTGSSEPSLAELLEEITKARGRSRAPREVDERPWTGPPGRGVGFPVAGCLIRIFGLGLLLFVAFVIFLFVLFGGLIGG